MDQSSIPTCAEHPDAPVVPWGKTSRLRRQRYVCLADRKKPHAPRRAITEDLLGLCVACERDWDSGYPVAEHAWYHLDHVVSFLRYIGQGLSLGKAIREAREGRHARLDQRAIITGVPRPPAFPPAPKFRLRPWAGKRYEIVRPEEDARLAGDWLDRYGALLVAMTADREWPADKPLVVDATKFKLSALYGAGTARAGQPKRGGDWGFAVLAGGVPTATGFHVVHARAVPNDGFDAWVAFFRSLPGRPKEVLADRWKDLADAAEFVWPGIRIHASTWHTWDLLRRRFNRARMYPGTHPLVKAGEAALADPALFRAWRARAMKEATPSIKKFLRDNGDAIQARLDGEGPYSTGAIERYLTAVRRALVPGRGRVSNLTRLDIRLALIAAHSNRQDAARFYTDALTAAMRSERLRRLPWRGLDNAGFRSEWVITVLFGTDPMPFRSPERAENVEAREQAS